MRVTELFENDPENENDLIIKGLGTKKKLAAAQKLPKYLHHGTSIDRTISILKNNVIKHPDIWDPLMDKPGVSLTTNFNIAAMFAAAKQKEETGQPYGSVLTLDAQKLLSDFSYTYRGSEDFIHDEEEYWIFGNIANVRKYLLDIDVDMDYAEEVLDSDSYTMLQEFQRQARLNRA